MNRTLKQITFSTTMLAAMLFTAQPLVAQTLTEAVTTTIKSNPLILAESYRSLSVDQTIGQAEAGYFPQVDLTAEKEVITHKLETITKIASG
jgi:outer membrane protein TolC